MRMIHQIDGVANSALQINNFFQVVADLLNPYLGADITWSNLYDAAGEVTSRSSSVGGAQALTWDSFGRLLSVEKRNHNNQGYYWSTVHDGLEICIQTSYADATGQEKTSEPLKLTYYYDPQVEYMELGHSFNGSRTWNLFGPDRSGRYGGAQGIGGLEAEYDQNSGGSYGVVNNYFGDTLGLVGSGGFIPYKSVLGAYGAMPGSEEVNQNLQPQWRGHYQDWTGFYSMGARYYEPKSGRFLSADPLGHGSSLSLYDYCGGDPVNGLDPDGRCVEKGRELGILDETQYQNAMYMGQKIKNRSPNAWTTFESIVGMGLSYIDGDLSDPHSADQQPASPSGIYSMNGMLTSPEGAQDIGNLVAFSMGINNQDVIHINNNTRGLARDALRVIGEQLLAIDIRAMRTADTVNASNGGTIVAHSNASTVIAGARPYMNTSVAANINYIGINPQWHIDAAQYGFKSAINIKNKNDIIPKLSPGNWFKKWDALINLNSLNPIYNHSFKDNYSTLTGVSL